MFIAQYNMKLIHNVLRSIGVSYLELIYVLRHKICFKNTYMYRHKSITVMVLAL